MRRSILRRRVELTRAALRGAPPSFVASPEGFIWVTLDKKGIMVKQTPRVPPPPIPAAFV